MNLLGRARAQAIRSISMSDFGLPGGYDPFSSLMSMNSRPVDGKYEVTQGDLDSLVAKVYKESGPIFALIAVRMLLFQEARFQWQSMENGRPGELYDSPELDLLRRPWAGVTCRTMLARMEQDVSILGNAFITNYQRPGRVGPQRLRRLRPDWVYQIWGSEDEPDLNGDAIDGELIAHVYLPRQPGAFGDQKRGTVILPEEMAHYAPIPDPQCLSRGMSWLTPILREIRADQAALTHKEAFFKNGAVSRLAVKVDPSTNEDDFKALVAMMEQQHTGPWNAYKTLYIGGGADPVPMTFNLKDLDFHAIQGGGETRLASAAGVPSSIVGFSEGLQGSALNAGNYQSTKRRFGDGTLRPLWGGAADALGNLVEAPEPGDRLWYDDRDIAFLRDDSADAAEIAAQRATTIRTLIDAGYEPDASMLAGSTGDFAGLKGKHTGLFSVQLQPPVNGTNQETPAGTKQDAPAAPTSAPTEPAAPAEQEGS